jgi:hypothetical protein
MTAGDQSKLTKNMKQLHTLDWRRLRIHTFREIIIPKEIDRKGWGGLISVPADDALGTYNCTYPTRKHVPSVTGRVVFLNFSLFFFLNFSWQKQNKKQKRGPNLYYSEPSLYF